jgi:hypothetical protein
MDEVTRRKLDVKFGETYDFEVAKAGLKGGWGLWWAWGASEMGYRVATRLATLGTVLAILGLGLGVWQIYPSRTTSRGIPSHSLTVGDVFSLRDKYGDLIGKSRDAVIERYGAAKPAEHDDWLVYSASVDTSNRPIAFFLVDGTVNLVKVLKRDGEELDVLELVKKAPLFDFGSGTFTDATKNYLIATTKDHRTAFQFSVSDVGATFEGVMFAKEGL